MGRVDSPTAVAYLAIMAHDAPKDAAPPPAEMEGAAPGKALTPAARRALEEAAARRAAAAHGAVSGQPERDTGEQGGPSGLEPTRFGDWERKGIAVDF
jgi:hypothetical protein